MEPSYIGAVWMFGGNFAPINFAFCAGQLQAISENEALYTLLGTTYGGDGVQTFALPDLQGRCVVGQGTGPGLPAYVLGQKAGTETVTLTTSTMAAHTHLLNAGTGNATSQTPASNLYINQVVAGTNTESFYTNASANTTLVGNTIQATGSNIPFEILQPFTVISYVIALYGIYPTQN